MPIRPLRPLDVVALFRFHGQRGTRVLTSRTWPELASAAADRSLAPLLSAALFRQQGGRGCWIATDRTQVRGVALSRRRADGHAWDVELLELAEGAGYVGSELLDQVAESCSRHGGRRMFLEAAEDSDEDVMRRVGFERYSGRTVYVLQRGFAPPKVDEFGTRPRLRADEHPLFQLYSAAVPAPTRAAEALTLEEWQGLHRGPRLWAPSFTGTRQEFVWELGATLVGQLSVEFAASSQHLEFLVNPRFDQDSDRLVRSALLQLSPRAPVLAGVREYQASLGSALERAGFRKLDQRDLYVKLLAARVREPGLLPAKVIGS